MKADESELSPSESWVIREEEENDPRILSAVNSERVHQRDKWGPQTHSIKR